MERETEDVDELSPTSAAANSKPINFEVQIPVRSLKTAKQLGVASWRVDREHGVFVKRLDTSKENRFALAEGIHVHDRLIHAGRDQIPSTAFFRLLRARADGHVSQYLWQQAETTTLKMQFERPVETVAATVTLEVFLPDGYDQQTMFSVDTKTKWKGGFPLTNLQEYAFDHLHLRPGDLLHGIVKKDQNPTRIPPGEEDGWSHPVPIDQVAARFDRASEVKSVRKTIASLTPLRLVVQAFHRRKTLFLPHAGHLEKMGLTLGESSTRLFVLAVQPGSFAATAHVEAGMEIVGMNGRALVRYADLHGALALGPAREGMHQTMIIDDLCEHEQEAESREPSKTTCREDYTVGAVELEDRKATGRSNQLEFAAFEKFPVLREGSHTMMEAAMRGVTQFQGAAGDEDATTDEELRQRKQKADFYGHEYMPHHVSPRGEQGAAEQEDRAREKRERDRKRDFYHNEPQLVQRENQRAADLRSRARVQDLPDTDSEQERLRRQKRDFYGDPHATEDTAAEARERREKADYYRVGPPKMAAKPLTGVRDIQLGKNKQVSFAEQLTASSARPLNAKQFGSAAKSPDGPAPVVVAEKNGGTTSAGKAAKPAFKPAGRAAPPPVRGAQQELQKASPTVQRKPPPKPPPRYAESHIGEDEPPAEATPGALGNLAGLASGMVQQFGNFVKQTPMGVPAALAPDAQEGVYDDEQAHEGEWGEDEEYWDEEDEPPKLNFTRRSDQAKALQAEEIDAETAAHEELSDIQLEKVAPQVPEAEFDYTKYGYFLVALDVDVQGEDLGFAIARRRNAVPGTLEFACPRVRTLNEQASWAFDNLVERGDLVFWIGHYLARHLRQKEIREMLANERPLQIIFARKLSSVWEA
ncbi:unnamed protein product [Amoebophrya sp. A120]|nr:unnamed protein product [Amoebophrya sp. A120]|eukprot:GSA120T00012748001.1